MEDSHSERIFSKPSCIDSISFDILEYIKETEDAATVHYERIFLTHSYIESFFLWILEDDIKASGNAAIVKS